MRAKQSYTASGMYSCTETHTPPISIAADTLLRGQVCTPAERGCAAAGAEAYQDEGLLHDARNLMGTIGLYCDLLSMPDVLKPEHRHYAEELRMLGTRSGALIQRLLEYPKQAPLPQRQSPQGPGTGAAWQAGAEAVDGAAAPMAGTTSQPALSSIVAAAAHTEYDTGLSLSAVCALEPYWEALRKVYAPFESGLPGPTGRVYHHEIPGGQLSNLRQQAIALGLGDRFEEIEEAYAGADRVLGRLIKVTPSSKVVGDLALALVGAGLTADEFASDPGHFDIPDSVLGFLRGELGDPAGGWPEPLRTKALAGRGEAKPVQQLTPDDENTLALLGQKRQATLNRLLFPGPTKEFEAHREIYGDTSRLSANQFFYGLRQGEEHRVQLEPGVELLIGLEAISEPDERAMRTVMCIINGQLRPVEVRDRSIASTIPAAEKADRANPNHVAAPFAGVVTVGVSVGDKVSAGQTIATIEAMKMEAPITAPADATVERVAVSTTAQVEGGDLLAVLA